ncbi:hypothetical protein ALP13_200124 [Pseudomonas syringae pv. maculicola]|uniref:Uncharacterized protein n=1 Tax=Pseudomonas syringae pv. maculicola TaxID=59511 RepID=A0A3M6CBN2_PSEYM|nr:hypothetical protein ALP13_200124 [Pseudomonas syringae pv. maculicola]
MRVVGADKEWKGEANKNEAKRKNSYVSRQAVGRHLLENRALSAVPEPRNRVKSATSSA